MLALLAAKIFSLIPPTGNTLPLNVISPVIARSFLTFLCVITETKQVNMAIPALGPSFGVAPSGTWTWKLYFSNILESILSCSAFDLIYSKANVADSFMTLPKFPVSVKTPFPFEMVDSINKISPPTCVHAKPVTTPATSLFSYLSLSRGAPKILIKSS